MLRIGVTGGIGTGKSTVCKIFELLGIPVFYADSRAKKLYDNNEDLKDRIIQNFGEDMYVTDQENKKLPRFNKEKMRSIIFNDSGKLELLNSLVHPIMRKETKKWFDEQSTQYAIKEAALIVETNTLVDLDELILVESPIAIRMKRLGIRDHLCPEEIKQRMKSQLPEEEKKKYATQIIVNDEKMLLIPQILALHTLFLEKARS